MPRAAALPSILLLLVAFAPGCSPEGRAKGTLEKYEAVFRACKAETSSQTKQPGEHPCSLVTSRAVDMGLEASGVEESRWRPVLAKWLDDKGFRAYYVPPERRPKDSN